MSRFANWQTRLSAFLDSRRDTRFAYGAHDCCLFVADALEAMTGTDFAAGFRNRYHTRFGALRRMREQCIEATVDAVAASVFAAHGLHVIPRDYAQRGDVLLMMPQFDGAMLSIIALAGMPIIAAERGWLFCDRAYAVKAWHV